jgi:hypothetical protein
MTIADIQAEIRSLCDADSTSLTDAVLLRRINAAYEEVVGKLIEADDNWHFGDTNFSSLPTGLHTMTESTEEVQFNSSLLNVLRVEVLAATGLWQEVMPINMSEVSGALPEYEKTDGIPAEYIKRENFIILKPAPTATYVTLTNGLKVYFQRTADIFTSGQVATGTKTPGFASPYHILLCYKAALPYCASFKKDRVPFLMSEIARTEKDMLTFYGSRDRHTRKILRMKPISHR